MDSIKSMTMKAANDNRLMGKKALKKSEKPVARREDGFKKSEPKPELIDPAKVKNQQPVRKSEALAAVKGLAIGLGVCVATGLMLGGIAAGVGAGVALLFGGSVAKTAGLFGLAMGVTGFCMSVDTMEKAARNSNK